MTALTSDLDTIVRAYLECALGTLIDNRGDPLDSEFGLDDLSYLTELWAWRDCTEFFYDRYDDCMAFIAAVPNGRAHLGHNLWLNRNRHGTGFWDHGLGELGDRLDRAACAFGEAYLYVGDDGQLHHD